MSPIGVCAVAAILLLPNTVDGQARARVDLPLLDIPDNFAFGYRAPSMQQSLALTTSFYQLAHAGILRALSDHRLLSRLAVLGFDLVATYLPPGEAWLHEEYHRAVMSSRGISSYNGTYGLELFAEIIAVSRVLDDELVRLKREQPGDQVRLMQAGVEGDWQLVLAIGRERFFYDAFAAPLGVLWMTTANAIAYVASGGPDIDELTDEQNEKDGSNIAKRDFTGHDFSAWVYDLHRPDEPYSMRGIHPSGVGIDRYIKWSDLNATERAFLVKQGRLAFLNLLDSNLLGIRDFALGNARVNLSARHQLTSFGYAIDANFFLRRDDLRLFAVLHNYFNGERYFPGASIERLDQPIALAGRGWLLSSSVGAWLQPKDQAFRTRNARPGILLGARLERPDTMSLRPYLEVEAKTAGWVAGNVHLGPAANLRLGVRKTF